MFYRACCALSILRTAPGRAHVLPTEPACEDRFSVLRIPLSSRCIRGRFCEDRSTPRPVIPIEEMVRSATALAVIALSAVPSAAAFAPGAPVAMPLRGDARTAAVCGPMMMATPAGRREALGVLAAGILGVTATPPSASAAVNHTLASTACPACTPFRSRGWRHRCRERERGGVAGWLGCRVPEADHRRGRRRRARIDPREEAGRRGGRRRLHRSLPGALFAPATTRREPGRAGAPRAAADAIPPRSASRSTTTRRAESSPG